jgi:hypothetical protein
VPQRDASSPNKVPLLKLLLPAAMSNTVAFSSIHSMEILKDAKGTPETITVIIPMHRAVGPELQHRVYVNGVHRRTRHPRQHCSKGQAEVLRLVDYHHCCTLVTLAAPAAINGTGNCRCRQWQYAPPADEEERNDSRILNTARAVQGYIGPDFSASFGVGFALSLWSSSSG